MVHKKYSTSFLFLLLLWMVGAVPAFAQLRSRTADEWVERLERDSRLAGLKIPEVIERLRLKPGHLVADIGAGSGLFSRPLAAAVSPGGRVYAVEVDPGLIEHLTKSTQDAGIKNLEPVLGEFDEPKLPTQRLDLAFFHDVLHHIEHRQLYLKTLAGYLKLEGRVAIIDMNNEHPDSPHRDHPDVQVTAAQIKEWMAAAGFRLAEEYYLFERKYFLVFERADPAADHSITGQNSKLHPTVEELVDAAAGCIF